MDKKIIKQIFIPLWVLLLGIIIATLFVSNPDEAKKKPVIEDKGFLVETAKIKLGDYPITVEAMGQITPAMEITLKPQVSGEIITASNEFVPGGFFESGEEILTIDPKDYQIAKQKQQAILQQAEADFRLEMGRQTVAKNELEILAKSTGKKLDNPDLALRAPQLLQAKAELDKAKSDLKVANLNLERTMINAPFNAIITGRSATIGDKVTPQTSIATLVSTDEYWVKISVPVNSLQWLEIPKGTGDYNLSFAKVIMDGGRGTREGFLLRMTGTVDTKSRLADMLVAIPDPLLLNIKEPRENEIPLILGDYVKVELEGKKLKQVARIPSGWVRDGNIVWIMKNNRMYFTRVNILYEDRNYAYIDSGLENGDVVVTSDVPVPVEGMKVRR